MKDYLYRWIQENHKTLTQSEWYEGCYEELLDWEDEDDDTTSGKENIKNIDVDFFINNYLGPLIESNIMYDFNGIEIDSRKLFG